MSTNSITKSAAAPSPLSMSREENNEQKSKIKERIETFYDAVKEKIDFDKVRTLAFGGIPDSPGLRSLYWKLLLGYLPNERPLWSEVLKQKRKLFQDFCVELSIDPRKDEAADDHVSRICLRLTSFQPLSTSTKSVWNAYFKDKELVDEIDKDVKRTLPHLHFFNHDKSVGSTKHYEALKRILFIYAKLNPGIKYVQGMNEILGPIYYIFASDPDADFKVNAEADAFFCFTNLMSEIRDNFCKTLDKSVIGITGEMERLNNILHLKDPELWQDFEDKKLNPQFYSFRWITLLLSQEFDLPDVLRLWDSLFADPFRFQFFLYVCTAMLLCLRDQLLDGSFADNLKMIQHYPLQDIRIILAKAEEISQNSYVPPPPRPKPVPPSLSPQETTRKGSSSATKVITKLFSTTSDEKIQKSRPAALKSLPLDTEDKPVTKEDISYRDYPVPPQPFSDDHGWESKVDKKMKEFIYKEDEDEEVQIHYKAHPLE